ncbi:MAG: DUF2007 domain-containing protein [Planctomycetota bacterium]
MDAAENIIPARLIKVLHEAEAGVIISTLANHNIEAHSTGDFTAGMRAETPGMIQIWVRQEDVPMAMNVIKEIKDKAEEIDWSKVDTGDESPVTNAETEFNQESGEE